MNLYLFLITMLSFIFWFLLIRDVPEPRTWFKDKGKNFISALPFLFVSMVLLACLFAVFSRYFSEIGGLHYE
jgi:cytochrome c oxidase assembly factor CtaG